MNQSITQIITVTTTPVPGAPNTGFLADNQYLPLIATVGGILLILAIILALWFRRGHPYARKIRGFLLIFGIIGAVSAFYLASTAHFTSAAASLTLTPENQTISVEQGTAITIPVTATLHTTSTAGYTLSLIESQSANGVSASIKTDTSGDITTDTPITGSPVQLKVSTSATNGGAVNSTLTIAAATNATPGTSALKLTYALTELTNPAICENANPASACQVDMDGALIPVTYTGTTASPQWSKADVNSQGNWYDYGAKHWANAVAVTSATRSTYQNAAPGTVIPENDVLGYYAYIPRYQYQVCRPNASDSLTLSPGQCQDGNGNDVLSTAAPYNFNIKFQNASQTTTFNGTTIGGWATHPAFTFGTTQLNGIWVGKYQTSTNNLAIASEANAASTVAAGNVFIKPNQYGLNNQDVSNEFTTAQSFADNTKATYQGLNAGTTDSRMMKNSDWGAVVYLATSMYGKGAAAPVHSNNCYRSVPNNNHNNRTGWGSGSSNAIGTTSCVVGANDSGAYQTAQGQGASTTGNTSGIYDMAGGNREYVMARLSDDTNIANYWDGSDFVNLPASKYYDNYSTTIFNAAAWDVYGNYTYCTWTTCGGQAFFETASVSSISSDYQSWLNQDSNTIEPGDPWVYRVGYGISSGYNGLFAMDSLDGSPGSTLGFRVVQSRF